jgi:hypothetical protein
MCWGRLQQAAQLAARNPNTQLVIDHLGLQQPFEPPPPAQPFAELPKVLALAAHPNIAIKISGACTLSHEPFPDKDIWTRSAASSTPLASIACACGSSQAARRTIRLERDREFADSPLEGEGFEPSVPRLRWSSVQLAADDATDAAIAKPGTPILRVDELGRAISACLARLSHGQKRTSSSRSASATSREEHDSRNHWLSLPHRPTEQSSRTSSMRQPLNTLLTIIVSPFTRPGAGPSSRSDNPRPALTINT